MQVKDKGSNNSVVAEMPLFCWWITGIKYKLLGAYVLMSFQFDYGTGRKWADSLLSGFKMWKGQVRKERRE